MSSALADREKDFEKLRREHVKLDGQIAALEAKRWVSAAEEAEIKRLKRLKLLKKDEMTRMTAQA